MMRSRVLATSDLVEPPVAVMLPGVGYTIQGPLLYWCAQMLAERGWHVQGVEWTIDADVNPVSFVERAVAAAFEAAPTTSRRLIVAKSFGSFALPFARREGIPGVWLTPVLTSEIVRESLAGASASHFAVGGDADAMWLPDAVANSRARSVTVAGADHSLTVTDGWRESLDAQSRVFESVSTHVDSLGW